MRLLIPFAVAALSIGLTACFKTTPVPVPFASSPYIFRGAWSGTTEAIYGMATLGEAKVNVTATYISAKSYTISGTLTVKGAVYSLNGQADATGGAYLTTQTSPVPDSFQWNTKVSLAGQVVGTLNGYQNVPQIDPDKANSTLTLDGIPYDLPLKRLQ